MQLTTNGIDLMIEEIIVTDDPHKYRITRDRFNHEALLFYGNTLIIYIPKGKEISPKVKEILENSKNITER